MRRHTLALLLAGWACTTAEPTAAPAPVRPAAAEAKTGRGRPVRPRRPGQRVPEVQPAPRGGLPGQGRLVRRARPPGVVLPALPPRAQNGRAGRRHQPRTARPPTGPRSAWPTEEIAGGPGIQTSTAAVRPGRRAWSTRRSPSSTTPPATPRSTCAQPAWCAPSTSTWADPVRAGASLAKLESAAVAPTSRGWAPRRRACGGRGRLRARACLARDGAIAPPERGAGRAELAEARAELTATQAALGLVGTVQPAAATPSPAPSRAP
jgi:hypothetical protein